MYRPILLVEDSQTDLDLALRAFAKRKVSNPLIVARDGAEALALLPRWEAGEPLPIVVLLDLNLPKVSGLEVLQALKQHPQMRVVPVVVLTSSEDNGDIQLAYRYGANSYIVKPVEFEKFVDIAGQIDLYWSISNVPPVT